MARSDLAQRMRVVAVGIPAVVVALYIGRWAMGPILALMCAGAALELYRMAEQNGIRPMRAVGAVGAATLVMVATLLPDVGAAAPALWTVSFVLVLGVALAVIWTRGVDGQPLLVMAVTAVGAILPAGAMSYTLFLRHMPVAAAPANELWASFIGFALVAYPITATWMTDSAAYLAGRRWGRRKLIPSVSPGKTVEGALAGLVGGTVGGLVVSLILATGMGVALNPLLGALGGLILGAISQAGDLAESVWKREAGVKDSGALFPGHGGLLDRMDSLLFTIPAAYWWLALLLAEGPRW